MRCLNDGKFHERNLFAGRDMQDMNEYMAVYGQRSFPSVDIWDAEKKKIVASSDGANIEDFKETMNSFLGICNYELNSWDSSNPVADENLNEAINESLDGNKALAIMVAKSKEGPMAELFRHLNARPQLCHPVTMVSDL